MSPRASTPSRVGGLTSPSKRGSESPRDRAGGALPAIQERWSRSTRQVGLPATPGHLRSDDLLVATRLIPASECFSSPRHDGRIFMMTPLSVLAVNLPPRVTLASPADLLPWQVRWREGVACVT